MNKNFSKWLPWIILAIVVVVALFFVDFDRVFNLNRTVSEKIETLTADVEVDDIDDDAEFDEVINESEEVDFVD